MILVFGGFSKKSLAVSAGWLSSFSKKMSREK